MTLKFDVTSAAATVASAHVTADVTKIVIMVMRYLSQGVVVAAASQPCEMAVSVGC